jgi:hypothetical protein
MTLKPWLLAVLAVMSLGLGAVIGSLYVPRKPELHIEPKENSCGVRCPADSAPASSPESVSCTAGFAPLCQCTDGQKPMAGCVPVN